MCLTLLRKARKDEEEDLSSYWMIRETRRCRKLKEEALDRTLWRTRFGRGYEPVVRQSTI
jgi:hypothetical protein